MAIFYLIQLNQNVSSISFNEKLPVLRSVIASTVLTCLSTGSSLQGLSALLATHGAMVSNFLAFIWTGQTVHFNCGTLIINHILLVFLICNIADTTVLRSDCLVILSKEQITFFTVNLDKLIILSFIVFQESCDRLLLTGLPRWKVNWQVEFWTFW